jgi:hypothetical protein
MTIQYTNRVGKTYYLREGKTKTGKPRYFFSAQKNGKGEPVDYIPEGYEVYEHPENAQVFLRKKRPQLITDQEKQLVKKHTEALKRSKRYRVECLDEYITIYESNTDQGNLINIFKNFLEHTPARSGVDFDDTITTLINVADRYYTAMLRFRLVEREQRLFTVERFCFRGAIDDWLYLDGPNNLDNLVKKWINMLGTDKFWDSPYF